MKTKNLFLLAILVLGLVSCKNDVTEIKKYLITFEDVEFGEDAYWNGSDLSGTPETVEEIWGEVTYYRGSFSSGVGVFNNNYSFGYWDGFACSALSDVTTAHYTNDLSAITGKGATDSKQYGVAYQPYDRDLFFEIPQNEYGYFKVESIMLTNSTYAYLYMKNGDESSEAYTLDDYFRVIIKGSKNEVETGSVTYALAETGNILNTWKSVDLSSLGEVDKITISFETSEDMTPTYVCIDNLLFTQEIEK